MGLLFSLPRKLKYVREADSLPLDHMYSFLRRSTFIYYILAVVSIVLAIIAFKNGALIDGGLYLGYVALALLRNGASEWDYKKRTVHSGYSSAVFTGLLTLYIVVRLFYGSIDGFNSYTLAIDCIIGVLYIFSSVISVYIHMRVMKRLQAGEDPRSANTPTIVTPIISPIVVKGS